MQRRARGQYVYFVNDSHILSCLVILVSGAGDSGKSLEVIFANGTYICNLPDLQEHTDGHSQDGLTVCGGGSGSIDTGDKCFTLTTTGQWTQSHTLLYRRRHHNSWALDDGRVRHVENLGNPGNFAFFKHFLSKQ